MFLWRKINYLCVKIFYIFNKLLCFLHLRRNRKNSGTILPMHMKQTLLNSDITLPVPTNEVSFINQFNYFKNMSNLYKFSATAFFSNLK